MFAMIRFGTIPMMDNRSLARRPGYADLMRQVCSRRAMKVAASLSLMLSLVHFDSLTDGCVVFHCR